MQKRMPMAVKKSKWQPEVGFQYGDHLVSETGAGVVISEPRRGVNFLAIVVGAHGERGAQAYNGGMGVLGHV